MVYKERLYAKTSFEICEAKRRSHELEKEMHRDSSANETVSLLLAHTGDPRWHTDAIGLPKILLNIVHFLNVAAGSPISPFYFLVRNP